MSNINDKKTDFSARLRSLMEERRVSQKALADAVRVSQPTVFAWLNGSFPRSLELYRVAKFFAVRMESFFEDVASVPLDDAMIRTAGPLDLPPEQFKAILARMKMDAEKYVEGAVRLEAFHDALSKFLPGAMQPPKKARKKK